ncbi:hypothetical protein COU60_00730 [Candidatus Pacearchaeota archaeon CG10_big_fil_rev_8_21_14_0_10_34_76]|nr:MAG: hypothetical protein COU60_00730 [Candidatus Pacearchaeota archaeon CG10_big_fil_rev_8_21_14_0_10_34_76]
MAKKLPKVSIVTCTYNGDRIIEEYFQGIFSQDYPLENIEIILGDGGSTDRTLKIIEGYIKKYPEIIKKFHNKMQFSIGKGYGMDQATRKANGEIIIQLDQDNILTQKNWISRMVQILEENKEISGVQSRYYVPNGASIVDKYVNALGIEDPFASSYSLNAQIVLNPYKFKYNKKGDFYVYPVNKHRFYYAGDNGFVIRKKDFVESGGYTQDIDNFYRMTNSKRKYLIAVPKEVRLYHKSSTELKHMLEKRAYYVGHYLLKNFDSREFYWFNMKANTFSENMRFVLTVWYNLSFFPAFFKSLSLYAKEKKLYWLIHAPILWIMTVNYIKAFFYSKLFKKQRDANI